MKILIILKILFFVHFVSGNLYLNRLNLLLNYAYKLNTNVDPNFLIGISASKGQLESLQKISDGEEEIQDVLEKCTAIEATIKNFKNPENRVNEFVARNIVNSTIWRHQYPPRKLVIGPKKFKSLEKYLNLVNEPTAKPNEVESDLCLSELFNNCEISNDCLSIMSSQKRSFGYQQTHKLLFNIFMEEKCQGQYGNDYWKVIGDLCGTIYEESKYVIHKIDEIPEFKDLFMEQVFLCGYVGFFEFVHPRWIAKILSWQNLKLGCFAYKNFECKNHISGLGAANLALFYASAARSSF